MPFLIGWGFGRLRGVVEEDLNLAMCVCVCICVHVCVCVRTCVRMFLFVCAYVCVRVCICLCVCTCACVCLPIYTTPGRNREKVIVKRNTAGVKSERSFSEIDCRKKVTETILPYYLFLVAMRKDVSMPYLRALLRSEKQTASSRIWI